MTSDAILTPSTDRQVELSIESIVVPEASALQLLELSGGGEISRVYQYHLRMVSADPNLNVGDLMMATVKVTVDAGWERQVIHGVLSQLTVVESGPEWTSYEAELVPRLARLSLHGHNRVFLNQTVLEIVKQVLHQNGFLKEDLDVRCDAGKYPPREFVMQYNESDLDFISRLMEHDGIFYFFEQGEDGETMVLGDSATVSSRMVPDQLTISYVPHSGLLAGAAPLSDGQLGSERAVHTLSLHANMVAAGITIKDYNEDIPSVDVRAHKEASKFGHGDVQAYGDHAKDDKDAKRYAEIRAQEIRCRERLYYGSSDCPAFQPGVKFQLGDQHPRVDFRQRYLITAVTHRAVRSHPSFAPERTPGYQNSFTAIAANLVFRPARVTPRPRIHGVMNAKIKEGDEKYAQIDDQGRYHVQLFPDLTDGGSHWIRMGQPYAGAHYGQHFPLHKGTEVLLTFVDGDIDRPIISAAVPNPLTPSPVTSANREQNAVITAHKNYLVMNDSDGQERVVVGSPTQDTFLQLGHHQKAAIEKVQPESHIGMVDGAVLHSQGDILEAARGNIAQCAREHIAQRAEKSFAQSARTMGVSAQDTLVGTAGRKMTLEANEGLFAQGGEHATLAGKFIKIVSGWTKSHILDLPAHKVEHNLSDHGAEQEAKVESHDASAWGRDARVAAVVDAVEMLATKVVEKLFSAVKVHRLKLKAKDVGIGAARIATAAALGRIELFASGAVEAIALAGMAKLGSMLSTAEIFGQQVDIAGAWEVKAVSQRAVELAGDQHVHLMAPGAKGAVELYGTKVTNVGFIAPQEEHDNAGPSQAVQMQAKESVETQVGDWHLRVSSGAGESKKEGLFLFRGKNDPDGDRITIRDDLCRVQLGPDVRLTMAKDMVQIVVGKSKLTAHRKGGASLKGPEVSLNGHLKVLRPD